MCSRHTKECTRECTVHVIDTRQQEYFPRYGLNNTTCIVYGLPAKLDYLFIPPVFLA